MSALIRRWWVVVPVLLLTMGGVVLVGISAGSQYQARATLLLAGPEIAPGDAADDGLGAILDTSVVIEMAEGDATRALLDPNIVRHSVSEVGSGVLRIEAVGEPGAPVVPAGRTIIAEVERVVEELDAEDDERAAEVRVLSEPRSPRQRIIVEANGDTRTEVFSVGSIQLLIAGQAPSSVENPYNPSGGFLRIIDEDAAVPAVSESIREAVGDPEASFDLQYDSRDAAAIVHVVATATTAETTMATMNEALAFLDEDVARRQTLAGADESTWIVFQRIALPQEAEVLSSSLGRPIAAVVGLGVVAAASLAILVDSLLAARPWGGRPRHFAAREVDETAPDDADATTSSERRRSRAS